MWADFHWLRPEYFWLLVPTLLIWGLFAKLRQPQSAWQHWIAPHLQKELLIVPASQQQKPILWLLLMIWLISVIALAGPSWQRLPQPVFQLKKATVILMDMSMSMRATDLSPDRLTQARFKALDYIDGVKEGELALVSFAGDAFVISPLTQDHNNVRLLLPELSPDIMPVQGSNLEAALLLADQLLKQGGYLQGDVVLFTDGFASSDYSRLRELMDSWPHRLSVLAFGTTQGAPIRLSNGELLKDNQGAIVLPRVPLAQLQQLAELRSGAFAIAGSEDSDIAALLALQPLDKKTDGKEDQKLFGDQWQDNAVYLVWLLMPLALWLHKRGALTVIVLGLLMPKAEAFEWTDLWQTQQQKAQQSYQQGDYNSAWQNFNDPLWKGNAAYRAQDYAAAEQSYRQLDTADASYNLGNSLAQQQKYQEAITAYQQALKKNPELTKAQQNLDAVKKALEQQKQQQQKGEGGQKDQQQGDPSGKESTEQGEGSESKQQSNEQESQQAPEQSAEGQGNDAASQKDQQPGQSQQQEQQQQKKQQLAGQAEEAKDAEQAKQQKAISEAWPNADAEQSQQLDNLLRKVQDDPSLLLRRKMAIEYQKRRYDQPPAGVVEEW
ncbi:VWA domain-containing protein [Rheinheimera sp.]|uniref:VWA domain-containing protein n=1 Tax=Rheinheimera sp. TaxID=1869214 RepID=UPI002628FBFF|nr:VWA domain-containing protein [Rheinheimera sp.]MCA1928750.1 VWA domain-containing protein [Rheinheimera sp.]